MSLTLIFFLFLTLLFIEVILSDTDIDYNMGIDIINKYEKRVIYSNEVILITKGFKEKEPIFISITSAHCDKAQLDSSFYEYINNFNRNSLQTLNISLHNYF